MLHLAVLSELLDDEAAAARDRLADRIVDLRVDGADVFCRFVGADGTVRRLRLAGRGYDALPFAVAVVDDQGQILPASRWPPGLYHSEHPFLHRPMTCTRGCLEYHTHPSHLGDTWDRYRHRIRLPDLLHHLLRKSGR